jgi:hypothetical protein
MMDVRAGRAATRRTWVVSCSWESKKEEGFSLLRVCGLLLNQPNASITWQALVWLVGLLVVFMPLSVWAYGRRTTR